MWVNRAVRSVTLVAAIAVTMVASPGVASAAGHTQSPTFVGYQVSDVPTTGTVTFTLPTLTCTPTNAGIVPSLVFTNFSTNRFTSAGVYVQCLGGVPNYGSLVEINNHFSYLTQTLSAGDKIRFNIKVTATSTNVTITDVTNHSSVKSTVSGPGGGGTFTGASVGDSAIGSPPQPVAQFSTLAFSAIKVNNAPLGAGGPLSGSDMYNGATLQISASNLSQTGSGFTTTFAHV